jgi:hypothetical protein
MMHRCDFCQRDFVKETSLAVHVCEAKRRHQERHERGVELGLQAYLQFYKTLQGSSQLKGWEDFAASSYYKAFVKWGRYCVNTRVINPARFLDWLLKHNKKIDRWASDSIYTEYLLAYLPVEAVKDAVDRADDWSQDWSERVGSPARDFLRYCNSNTVCHAVCTGRVSAWVLYNSDSGRAWLANLNSELMQIIWPYIDSDIWACRFREYPADQVWVEQIALERGW